MTAELDALAAEWAAAPHTDASDRFVLGDVRLDAEVLGIGEAPGEDEDRALKSFVGAAGQRLDGVCTRVGLRREDISLANVMPRRPLKGGRNRTPTDAEVLANGPFLDRLVRLHPNLKAVALMGGTALAWRMGWRGRDTKIGDYRGCEFRRDGLWWLPMYHPANSLYKPSEMKWLVQDLGWLKALAEGNLLDLSSMEFEFSAEGWGVDHHAEAILKSPISYVDIEAGAEPPVKAFWWHDPRVKPVLVSLAWLSNEGDADREFRDVRVLVVECNDSTIPALQKLLAGSPQHWAGSGALYYDFPMLRRLGMPPACERTPLDSYPIAKLVDENRGLGLKDLGKQHLRVVGHEPYWGGAEEEAWQSRWHLWSSMPEEERRQRIRYSGADAWVGIQVLLKEMDRLRERPHLVKVYRDLIVPGQATAVEEMRAEGMPLDLPKAFEESARLEAQIAYRSFELAARVPEEHKATKAVSKGRGKARVTETVVVQPNFGSHDQLSRLLFGAAGLPAVKPTPKQARESSDKFALLKSLDLEGDPKYPAWAFDVIRGSLEIGRLAKRKGYIDAMTEAASLSHDGKVHSNFRINPVTWRLASEDVNLQQLQTEVKQMFSAPEGWTFVKHDVTGLEVCGLADQSGDRKLIGRILDGMDLHTVHMCGFMGWDYNSFEKDDGGKPVMPSPFHKKCRLAFKTAFFGSGYGSGEAKLGDILRDELHVAGVTREDVLKILEARKLPVKGDIYRTLAREWLEFLGKEYPRLKESFWEMRDTLEHTRFVRGKFGAERHLPEIADPDENTQAEAHRQGYNFRPQNLSMLTYLAYRELKAIRADMGLEADIRLCVQEHDSLLWLARKEHATLWDAVCRHVMQNPDWDEWKATFAVPIRVEGSVDRIWK